MKQTIAYIVIHTSKVNGHSARKIAGVFWKKQNAENFAWQLTAESTDLDPEQVYTVEKCMFSKYSNFKINN